MTENGDLICVEIDTDTPTKTYNYYIESYEGTPRSLKFDMSETFSETPVRNTQEKLTNGYHLHDEMKSADSDGFVSNFLLPMPDLFGFCDNYKSVEFLKDVNHDTFGSCVQ